MKIKVDDLDNEAVTNLIAEHQEEMHTLSPIESVHALELSALKTPEITFYSAWIAGELAGCGALRALGDGHGEIKSMRTTQAHLRKGVAAKILDHIVEEAKSQDFTQLSLETGSVDAFYPAQVLYKRFGFKYCGPFGQYTEDPNSVFMTRKI